MTDNQKKLKFEKVIQKPLKHTKIEILHSMLGSDQVKILEMHVNLYHSKLAFCKQISDKFDV